MVVRIADFKLTAFVSESKPEAQSWLELETAGDVISRGTRATPRTDSHAGTGRLRVVVQPDGKTALEVEARDAERSIASGFGRTDEQAAEWAVTRGR